MVAAVPEPQPHLTDDSRPELQGRRAHGSGGFLWVKRGNLPGGYYGICCVGCGCCPVFKEVGAPPEPLALLG